MPIRVGGSAPHKVCSCTPSVVHEDKEEKGMAVPVGPVVPSRREEAGVGMVMMLTRPVWGTSSGGRRPPLPSSSSSSSAVSSLGSLRSPMRWRVDFLFWLLFVCGWFAFSLWTDRRGRCGRLLFRSAGNPSRREASCGWKREGRWEARLRERWVDPRGCSPAPATARCHSWESPRWPALWLGGGLVGLGRRDDVLA